MKRSMIVAMTAFGIAVAPAAAFAQTTTPHSDKMEKGKMEKSEKSKHAGTTGSASHKSGKAKSAPVSNTPDEGGGAADGDNK